jgi:hypothetical protein
MTILEVSKMETMKLPTKYLKINSTNEKSGIDRDAQWIKPIKNVKKSY